VVHHEPERSVEEWIVTSPEKGENVNTSARFCGCVLLLACLLAAGAAANDAVSMANFKIEGQVGNVDRHAARSVGGSVSIPVGDDFGLQIDGLAGEIDPEDFYGVGVHAFRRNPTVGLLGLIASHAELADVDATRVGAEGEYYLDRFTVAAYGGFQSGDIDDSVFGALEGRYYFIEDAVLSAGVALSDDHEWYGLGVEYQTPFEGVSLSLSFAAGERDYDHAFFGLRFYFGGEHKTLIRRHREDDPDNRLLDSVLALHVALPSTFDRTCPCGD
jgi:hypothetical protein